MNTALSSNKVTRNRKHRRAAAKPAACAKPLMLSTPGVSRVGSRLAVLALESLLRGPAVEHQSLADVLSLSYARLVADG